MARLHVLPAASIAGRFFVGRWRTGACPVAQKIQELREKQDEIYGAMRSLTETAEAEHRDLSSEERQRWDVLNKEYDDAGDEIRRIEESAKAEAERRERMDRLAEEQRSRGRRTQPNPAGGRNAEEEARELRSRAQTRFISHGHDGLTPEEKRALQNDSDTAGGFLKPDEQFVSQLIKGVDNLVVIRQLATKFTLTQADSLGAPSLEADPADADWTTELDIGDEDTTMSTGKRRLTPHPLAKLLKVSRTLMRRSVIPVDTLVRDRLAYKFAVTEESAFMSGSGAGRPLGVFTASNDGIPTSRDISTGNAATSIGADGLIEAKYALKSQYMMSSSLRWVFHRDAVKQIRKLKDGNGDYLWIRGLAGAPDTILEVPYIMSEYAPNTFTASQYVGIIGDFSWYWIVDALSMELQRLEELYAATNQVGFVGRMECDGMPVLAEAFARVKLAAS